MFDVGRSNDASDTWITVRLRLASAWSSVNRAPSGAVALAPWHVLRFRLVLVGRPVPLLLDMRGQGSVIFLSLMAR